MARIGNVDPNIYLNDFQKGVNNLSDSKSIDNNTLVDAINVDIRRDGKVESRDGFTLYQSLSNAHSGFSDNINIYVVEDNNLVKLNPNKVKSVIDTGYQYLKTNYTKQNNTLVISNKDFIRRYKNNKIYNIAPETFNNQFFVSYGSGSFPKGRYLISITYVFDDGMEGGTTAPIVAEVLNDNTSITLNNINQSTDINVEKIRVYISMLNSETLFKYSDYSNGTTTLTLSYGVSLGTELDKMHLSGLPSGDLITQYNGCIFTAKDNIVYFTNPLSYLTSIPNNYYEFDGKITLLESNDSGIYVSDEYSVYFLAGDNPKELTRKLVYNSPAVKGNITKNIMTNEIFFFTQMGQMVGSEGGKVENITEENYFPNNNLLSGASLLKFKNGKRQIINTFKKGISTNLSIGDSAEIEIIRN